jgi:hypothetical protein
MGFLDHTGVHAGLLRVRMMLAKLTPQHGLACRHWNLDLSLVGSIRRNTEGTWKVYPESSASVYIKDWILSRFNKNSYKFVESNPLAFNHRQSAQIKIFLRQHTTMRSSSIFAIAAVGAVASAYQLPANLKKIYDQHKVLLN